MQWIDQKSWKHFPKKTVKINEDQSFMPPSPHKSGVWCLLIKVVIWFKCAIRGLQLIPIKNKEIAVIIQRSFKESLNIFFWLYDFILYNYLVSNNFMYLCNMLLYLIVPDVSHQQKGNLNFEWTLIHNIHMSTNK